MDTDDSLTTHSHAYCINSVFRGHHVYNEGSDTSRNLVHLRRNLRLKSQKS